MNCHGKEAQRQGMRVQGEDRFAENVIRVV